MTGMFEAYPVDNPRGFMDRAGPLAVRLFPRAPFVTRCTRCLVALAADASEHGGRIICDGVDFRSKTAERQHANFAFIKYNFSSITIFEDVLVDIEHLLLHLYFCVRLRFSIPR